MPQDNLNEHKNDLIRNGESGSSIIISLETSY